MSDSMQSSQYPILIGLVLILLLTSVVYWPGLHGGFLVDDFSSILDNPHLRIDSFNIGELWTAALSGHAGPLKRPISMLSFALNIGFTGLDPYYFKLTNLGIHLVNGILVFLLARLLMTALARRELIAISHARIGWIALAAAAMWLLHPVNLTNVLYVVQRMNSLAAMFTLPGLVCYTHGRLRMVEGNSGLGWIAVCLMLGGAGALAKENAALLPLFMLVIEVVIFRFASVSRSGRHILLGMYALVLVLPLLAAGYWLIVNNEWLTASYQNRPYTAVERLLTETRAIWFYLGLILVPAISRFSLYHDDFGISTGILDPVTTLPALAGLLLLLLAAVWYMRRLPVLALGILFFLAGHSMESTILPLEPVFEHRNYLPLFGICMIISYYLLQWQETKVLRPTMVACIVAIGLFAGSTALRATQWNDTLELSLIEAEHNPESAIAQYQAGVAVANLVRWLEGQREREEAIRLARHHLLRAIELDQEMHQAYVSLVMLLSRNHYDVEPGVLVDLKKSLREGYIRPGSVRSLISLFDCLLAGECHLEGGVVEDMINNLEKNPGLSGKYASIIYVKYSEYIWKKIGAEATARRYMEKAVKNNPEDPAIRLNYASLLAAQNKNKEALEQIRIAEKYDRWNMHGERISALETVLAQGVPMK